MKMKKRFQLLLCIVTFTFTCARAEESPEEIFKRLVEKGSGAQEPKKDSTGALQSLWIVGQAEISKVLGPAKGLMLAQKRASLVANAKFVEWMESNVTSVETLDDQSIVVKTGVDNKLSEQGKSDEKNTTQITQAVQGLVKGLKLVGKDQDPKTGVLTLVYSWSPAGAQLANEAKEANNRPPGTQANPNQKPNGQPPGDIQKKTIISPDFNE